MGKIVTIVIQNAPYKEGNKAWHALRFAGAALTQGMDVRVHLLDDGVLVGTRDQEVPEGEANLEKLMEEFMEFGMEVKACGMYLDDCALDEGSMIVGIGQGSMQSLASWVNDSDHVLTF
jgi:sulfur relay (sulfurtransferase) complex TusBCD TusD component (DsrE family)